MSIFHFREQAYVPKGSVRRSHIIHLLSASGGGWTDRPCSIYSQTPLATGTLFQEPLVSLIVASVFIPDFSAAHMGRTLLGGLLPARGWSAVQRQPGAPRWTQGKLWGHFLYSFFVFVSVRTIFGYRSVCVCPLWSGFMRLLCSRFYASFVLLVFMRLLCLGLCIDVLGT